jgi:hypothetical protein
MLSQVSDMQNRTTNIPPVRFHSNFYCSEKHAVHLSDKTLLRMLRPLVFSHFNTFYTHLYIKYYTPIVYQQGASVLEVLSMKMNYSKPLL